mmetsp:Transcript_16887/g.30637  ORF Transcript_16887/g.30637 Transcript_16887/m.30637 type:complete len:231 (+) Transcript_16887:422-1114(+)
MLCFFDTRHFIEHFGVGNAQGAHPVLMAPLLEVLFKGSTTPVAVISADFAFKFLVQTVQFIKPVGNWLAIPSNGQFQRIINEVILFFLVRISTSLIESFFTFLTPRSIFSSSRFAHVRQTRNRPQACRLSFQLLHVRLDFVVRLRLLALNTASSILDGQLEHVCQASDLSFADGNLLTGFETLQRLSHRWVIIITVIIITTTTTTTVTMIDTIITTAIITVLRSLGFLLD